MDAMRAYAALGVTETASRDELRHAYRRALRRCHPDTGVGDPSGLQTVMTAYHELVTLRPRAAAVSPPAATEAPVGGEHIDVYA